jgi:putative endonuclease
MLYTVYILYSANYNQIYIGHTSHLINRFHSHNQFGTKDWTKNFRPWVVIYCEFYEVKGVAMKREKQLKSAAAREQIKIKIATELSQIGYIKNL